MGKRGNFIRFLKNYDGLCTQELVEFFFNIIGYLRTYYVSKLDNYTNQELSQMSKIKFSLNYRRSQMKL